MRKPLAPTSMSSSTNAATMSPTALATSWMTVLTMNLTMVGESSG
jgi:hypothetical protein